MTLIADGAGFHVPKGYIYAAIGFSVGVEALNQLAGRRRLRRGVRPAPQPKRGEGAARSACLGTAIQPRWKRGGRART